MADTAGHREREVLPQVPIRHWICSLPWGLRALLGYDRELLAGVTSAFAHELSRSLRFRAKKEFGLRSVRDAHTGMVTAIQRVDSALRLNVHMHTLALDGVYVRRDDDGSLAGVARSCFLRSRSPWMDRGSQSSVCTPKKAKVPIRSVVMPQKT